MNVQAALTGQYHAALAMLKQAIEQCPDGLWTGSSQGVPFWRVAYHTLYYTDMYLQPDEAAFRRWQLHRDGCQTLPSPADSLAPADPYTKDDLLRYLQLCDDAVDEDVQKLDLSASQSGFSWHKMPKLHHQLHNLRHLQHHTALLSGRLRQTRGTDIRWVRRNHEMFVPGHG
jgi:hypothetical protein